MITRFSSSTDSIWGALHSIEDVRRKETAVCMAYLNAHPVAKPKSSIGRREASCSRYDLELVADRPAFHPCPVGAPASRCFFTNDSCRFKSSSLRPLRNLRLLCDLRFSSRSSQLNKICNATSQRTTAEIADKAETTTPCNVFHHASR